MEANTNKQQLQTIFARCYLQTEEQEQFEWTFTKLEGFSNEVFKIEAKNRQTGVATILVGKARLKGNPNSELTVDHSAVIRYFKSIGYGPKIYYEDESYVLEEFLTGETCTFHQFLTDSHIFMQSVLEVAGYSRLFIGREDKHLLVHPLTTSFEAYAKQGFLTAARRNLQAIIDRPETPEPYARLLATISEYLDTEARNEKMLGIMAEVNQRKMIVCHNDFFWLNVKRQADGSIRLLDYEYTGYNPIGWDIVHMYCERNFFLNDGGVFEYNIVLPDERERSIIFKLYLLSLAGHLPADSKVTVQLVFDVATGKFDDKIDTTAADLLISECGFYKLMAVVNLQWIYFNCKMLEAVPTWPIAEYTIMRMDLQRVILSKVK